MALVNDEYKFIFFHIYKCAGTSIRESLTGYEVHTYHSVPLDLSIEHPNLYNKYYKFTIVRNPFDFMVSLFLYIRKYESHFWNKEVSAMGSLEEFILFYESKINKIENGLNEFGKDRIVTFKSFITEGNFYLLDRVLKLENINDEFSELINHLNMPKIELPVKNKNRDRVSDFKKYYTDHAKRLVERLFEWEIDYFKYKY